MPRLLVVDDTWDIRQTLKELLELEGFAVTTASDGVEGCTAARTELPDLVIMDGQMPRCDGYEATRRIKTDPATRSILVLFCSCWNGTEAREKALNAVPTTFLSDRITSRKSSEKSSTCYAAGHPHERGNCFSRGWPNPDVRLGPAPPDFVRAVTRNSPQAAQ